MKKNIYQMTPHELGQLPAAALANHVSNARIKAAGMKARNDERQRSLAQTMSLTRTTNVKKSSPFLPGNIEDLNKIVWPFIFQTEPVQVPANAVANANINVTQEAAFVITHMTKVVYEVTTGPLDYNYLNPKAQSSNTDVEQNLFFDITDSQSSRTWTDEPISINHMGDAKDPLCLETPYMVLQNQNIEVRFSNNDASRVYIASMAFHGYRIRLEEAQGILSLQSN